MAALYWKHARPKLPIETDPNAWKSFIGKTAEVSPRGVSLLRIFRHLPVSSPDPLAGQIEDIELAPEFAKIAEERLEKFGLKIEDRTFEEIDDLVSLLDATPPIPAILVYDHIYMLKNVRYGQHAVLLHHIDFGERKIFVIDPGTPEVVEPYPYDLGKFEKAWRIMGNLSILVYPPDMVVQTGDFRGVSKQSTLDSHMKRRSS